MFIFIFLKKAKAMKKIVLIVLIFITTVGFSQTDVSGALSSDTTWSLSNSPIILTGNVLVPNGVTLTIEAGVTVRINSEKYLKVQGSLIAIGTESNKITFTSNESSPAKGDWDKIWLASTSTSFDGSDNYVSGTIFNHCIISYADEGLRLDDSSFYLVNSELTENNKGINFRKVINSVIDNNNFNNNGSGTSTSAGTEDNGIGSFTFTKFLNNTFKNNTGDGLSFGGYRNNANNNLIKNNISINNGGNGFYFGWGDVVRGFADNTIDGNIIYNNSGNGITVGRDSNIIKKNFIVNNEGSGINISGTYIYEGLTIENNIISGNLGYGLDLTSNTNSLIRYNSILNSGGNSENPSLGIPNSYIISNNNTITYNTIYASENSAIELRYGPNTFNNNNFISTKGNYIFKLLTENNSDINAENNYWGTSTESEIQSVIYDYSDDFELGAVDYTPFLTSPNTDAPISPPSNVTKQASGSDIVLSWSANGETDIAGYKLHYGSPTGYSYSTTVDLGNVTTYTVTGGDITTEYSITAYDSSIDGTDDMVDGNESWFSLAIAAVNDPPVAYYSDVAATEQTPVTITLTGYDHEEQALTYIITSIPQDGTLSDNGTEIKSEDLPKTLSSSDITYVSTSDSAVDDNFVFKVNDGELDSTSAYIDIYIEAVFDDPIAESNTVEATEQVTLNFTLGGSNPDDNGINVDELVFIITSLPENGTLFENNNTYEIKDEDLPHTILDNDIWYTSTSDSATTDSFTFKVNADVVNDSEAATVSIAITAVNDVPVAFADTETVDEDAATTSINVIANDTDVDTGDTLELTAVDIAGTGTVGINADGLSVDYTPAFNFNGTETITYTVSDGELTDTTGTLTITVTSVNDAPTITSTAETAATEDMLYSYTIATNDVDADDLVTLTSSDLPSWLALTGNVLSGTPLEGDVGVEITITAIDDGEGSLTATQTFTIVVTAVNDAPVVSDHVLFLDEGGIATTLDNSEISLLYNASDIEDDSFIAIIESEPAYGILVLNTDGTFSYTHDGSDTLTDSFSYRADDSNLTSEIGTVSIIINPDNDNAPTDINLSNNLINENVDSASGFIIGQFTAIDLDLPSDTHTFELVDGAGDTDNSSFIIDGNNLKTFTSFDFETQSSFSIRVITTDGETQSFEKVFTVAVVNIGDISIESQTTNSYCEGDTANGAITISDITNTAGDLVFSWSASNGGSIPIGQENNQNLTDLKDGTYTVVVSDATDFILTEEFQINLINQYSDLSVCYVSSDENEPIKNRIFINNQGNYNISSYEVLRETNTANVYNVIGNIDPNLNSFLDNNSDNNSQEYRYKVRLVDLCENTSQDSELHKTILLQSSISVNNNVNLSWTDYEGADVPSYNIYRKINNENYELLREISSNSTSYNDQNADASLNSYEYYIAVQVNDCNIASSKSSSKNNLTEIKSNRQQVGDSSLSLDELVFENSISIYPNPATNTINITINSNTNYIKSEIYNILSQRILKTNKKSISIENLSKSTYFLKIYTEKGIAIKKFIKN